MKYMGSKSRIAKHILPIMLEDTEKEGIETWVEPFVGGGNMIDKVPDTFKRIGYDSNIHTIEALINIRDNPDLLPDNVSEEEYRSYFGLPHEHITSWVRFVCSYSGKFEGGYARGGGRNYAAEGKRNALKQSKGLQGVWLRSASFEDLSFTNSLIYCDPPYQNSSGYKTGDFNHEKFFEWCREQAKNNLVFVSEYTAPEDFKELWRGEVKTNFAHNRKEATHNAVEKLFKVIV